MNNYKNIKVVYMGTPELSARTFEALINSGVNFVALITQEDKPVGRKQILQPSPTKLIANKYNIPVYQPHRIREDFKFLYDIKPDLILTFAYGQILPKELLTIPNFGCLNLHGSILPKYRGAAPIQRALMNGDKLTGISLMEMIDKMDAGRVYAIKEIHIEQNDNYSSLCLKMSDAAIAVFLANINDYLSKKNVGQIQDENNVTFANKITSDEEHININKTSEEQINTIRALSEMPGAYLYLNNEKIKVFHAHKVLIEHSNKIGSIFIFEKKICYYTVDGAISLDVIQPQNKGKMSSFDFYNGHKDIINLSFK